MLVSENLQSVGKKGTTQLLATDSPMRFARVGGIFLGERIDKERVESIDL
jgi:hypothetical protein